MSEHFKIGSSAARHVIETMGAAGTVLSACVLHQLTIYCTFFIYSESTVASSDSSRKGIFSKGIFSKVAQTNRIEKLYTP